MELTKFAAQINREDFKDEMSKWLYLLKNIGQMDEQDSTQESDIFRKFYETCRMSKLTTMEKEEYTKSVLEYEDVQDALDYMRKTSLKEGFEKGLAEGKAEGLAEGKAEGKAEAKLAMAKSMLVKGIDLDTIISITGLTAEEIER
ncbi:MAG: PD-(D/E)XK nuclease family transposase [Bacteroidales bacterium]|nr:PD-(D/E)XK nuclease family transposase [Bacteroidales bacterium]